MNFHPLVVHFPIVCLILYSMIEIGALFSAKLRQRLTTTKYFLLYIGIASGRVALKTGETAKEIVGPSELVETHGQYGTRTYNLYLIIAVIYVLIFLNQRYNYQIPHFLRVALSNRYIPWLIGLAAMAGLLLITITGALGAAISHGPQADIIVEFFYNLLL